MQSCLRPMVITGIAMTLLMGCSESPEKAIRERLQSAADGYESGDRTTIVDLVSDQYSDPDGNDKQAVLAALAMLAQGQRLYVAHSVREIQLDEGNRRARVGVHVALAGRPIDSVAAASEMRADLYRVDLEMADEEGEWRVVSARWRGQTLKYELP